MTSGDYYVPMGSQALYREYAEGLLGRPAATQEELESMQLVLRCGPLFATIQNMGFPYMEHPPRFGQTCVAAGLPSFPNLGIMSGNMNVDYVQAVCLGMPATRPDGSMALSAGHSFSMLLKFNFMTKSMLRLEQIVMFFFSCYIPVSTMDSIIWVNPDETVLLTYRCPANGIKDYKVVSKTKRLNQWDIDQIKEKVMAMGFKEDHITFMKYDDSHNEV